MQDNLSPQQSLQVIQSMIEQAKNQYSENGHLYLLWGWLIFACSIAQYVLLNIFHNPNHYLVWMATWVAVIYQFFYLRKERRKQKFRTYADTIIGFVWLSFFILLLLIGFLLGWIGSYKYISPAFLALYGMPTFLSGIMLRFRPLVVGGIGCWVLSLVAYLLLPEYQLLLLGLAMIIAWIIPGYILRAKYKNQHA